jgi:hypothetical protein
MKMNIPGITVAAMAMATDTRRTPTNLGTTAIPGTVTVGIIGMRMMIGMDGVMNTKAGRMADGVMRGGIMADGAALAMAAGVMAAAVDVRSRIQDTAADTIAADPTGHRIAPAQSCSVNFDAHTSTCT